MTTMNDFNKVNNVTSVKAEHINELAASTMRAEYSNVETLSGTRTLLDADTPIQRFDCNGTSRNVLMPTANTADNHPFWIVNASGAGETLTVKTNDGATTLSTISDGDSGLFIPDGNGSYDVVGTSPLSLMNSIYPVGIVVTLGVSTNPATLFGIGTWTAIAGKVIVGINAGDAEFDTLDETGGSKTHTLTLAETPAITIPTRSSYLSGATSQTRLINADTTGGATGNFTSGGSGSAHNNLQPYIVKYVWQRTA